LISKGALRLGVRIEGPFGPGFLWHHLNCAAKRQMDRVEEAYALLGPDPEFQVPPIQDLRQMVEKAEKKKQERKTVPYVEKAPTGRSKCKRCGQAIEKGSFRIAVLRKVEFYGQIRHGPVNVHPACVASELAAEDSATEPETLFDALRTNSRDLTPAEIDQAIDQIGNI
jgi:hypothetical protein